MITANLIIGLPGSGKSTIGKLLEQRNPEFVHISTGNIFRSIKERGIDTKIISMINELDKTRSLYPDELTQTTLETYLLGRIKDGTYNPLNQTIIFDGFPRNLSQYTYMKSKYFLMKTVLLEVPECECTYRIINKRNLEEKRPEDQNIKVLQKSIEEHKIENSLLWTNIFIDDIRTNVYSNTREIEGNQTEENVYKEVYDFFKP